MYECSEHYKLDQLEREHVTTEYANNKKAHEDYVSRNYPVNPDTSADPARVEDIEKKCDELLGTSKKGQIKADNILNKLGLGVLLAPPKELFFAKDLEERGVVATKNRSEYEAQTAALGRAKKDMLNKVQDFFKTHSKSSIVEILKQTPNPSAYRIHARSYFDPPWPVRCPDRQRLLGAVLPRASARALSNPPRATLHPARRTPKPKLAERPSRKCASGEPATGAVRGARSV
jgi:hypothetical protein